MARQEEWVKFSDRRPTRLDSSQDGYFLVSYKPAGACAPFTAIMKADIILHSEDPTRMAWKTADEPYKELPPKSFNDKIREASLKHLGTTISDNSLHYWADILKALKEELE